MAKRDADGRGPGPRRGPELRRGGRRAATSGRVRAIAAALGLAGGAFACGEVDGPPAEGPRLELVETSVAEAPRSVTLGLTLAPGGVPGEIDLEDVSLVLDPPGPTSVRKLESVLDDVVLGTSGGGLAEPVHAVPPEAWPALRRIALSLAIRDDAGAGGQREQVHLRLFDGPLAIGMTRLRVAAGDVALQTLSLAPGEGGAVVVWGEASGRRTAEGFHLEGFRRILGRSAEGLRLEAKWPPVPQAAGATRAPDG